MFGKALQQQASNPKGRLVRTIQPGSRDATWGFLIQGCSLPLLTLRVSWIKTTERQKGQSTTANGEDKVVCWQRIITVVSVVEANNAANNNKQMQCTMRFDSNGLRALLAVAAVKYNNNNDYMRQDVIAFIMTQV